MKLPDNQRQFRYGNPDTGGARLQGMQVQTAPAMFGGAQAQTLGQAGQNLLQTGNLVARLADDYDSTVARDAVNRQQQDFLQWQAETRKLQGKDGRRAAQAFDAWAEERSSAYAEDMNDIQRERFQVLMGERLAPWRRWAESYGRQQDDMYTLSIREAEKTNAANMLAVNIADPELARQALEQIKDAAFSIGKHQGLDDATGGELLRRSVAEALTSALQARVRNDDLETARNLVRHYAPQLDDAGQEQLRTDLHREHLRRAETRRSEESERRRRAAETLAADMQGLVDNGGLDEADALTRFEALPDPALREYARSCYAQRRQLAELSRREAVARGYALADDAVEHAGGDLNAQYERMVEAVRAARASDVTPEQRAYARALQNQYDLSVRAAGEGVVRSAPDAFDAVTRLAGQGAALPTLRGGEDWSRLSPADKKLFVQVLDDGRGESLARLSGLYDAAFSARPDDDGIPPGDRERFLHRAMAKLRDDPQADAPDALQQLVDRHVLETVYSGGLQRNAGESGLSSGNASNAPLNDPLDGTLVADAADSGAVSDAPMLQIAANAGKKTRRARAKKQQGATVPRKPFSAEEVTKMVQRYRTHQPDIQRVLEKTQVPEDLLLTFAILESNIKTTSTGGPGSTAKGIMQVIKGTREHIETKNKNFDANFAREFAAMGGDPTLYYGALYMREIAKESKLDLQSPDVLDTAQRLYMAYMMGPTGARRFLKLRDNDSVEKGNLSNAIKNNPHFFIENGTPVTKAEAERRLRGQVSVAYEALQKLREHLAAPQEEGQPSR